MRCGAILVGVLVWGPAAEEPDRLAEVRALLEEPAPGLGSPVLAATARLRESDVPAALESLTTWPADLSLKLKRGLVEDGRLRGALLEAACRGPDGSIARRILVQQLVRLQSRDEPFVRPEYGKLDRVRLPKLTPLGVRVRWLTPPGTHMPMAEFLRLLEDASVTELPFVVWPGALDDAEPLRGPVPLQSAEWLLHRTLEQRGLVPVRLLRATWVLPVELMEPLDRGDPVPPEADDASWPEERLEQDDSEIQVRKRLHRREAQLFERAVDELARREDDRRALEAVELITAIGLPCSLPPEPDRDAWSRARALVAAVRRDPRVRDAPLVAGPEEWWRPVLLRARLAQGGRNPDEEEFLVARTRPADCDARAVAWLGGSSSSALVDVIAGLGAAARERPDLAKRAVLDGRRSLDGTRGAAVLAAPQIEDRRLDPGKGEVEGVPAQERARQDHGIGIPLAGLAFHRGSPRVGKAENGGDLVEGLADRIVLRPADHPSRVLLDDRDLAVPSRHDDSQVGEGDMLPRQRRGLQVRLQVIDADQRDIPGPGQSLGGGHSDQQRPDEPRSVSDRNRGNLRGRDARFAQALLDHRGQGLDVGPAGDLRDDAAVGSVELGLGADDLGEEVRGHGIRGRVSRAGGDDRGGGLVAGGLDAQDDHGREAVSAARSVSFCSSINLS